MVILLALAFILELIAFAGFAAIAFCFRYTEFFQIIIALILLTGLITFWSIYMAPKASKKFSPLYYYIAKFIIYAISTFAMVKLWGTVIALSFVVIAIIDEIILYKHNLERSYIHAARKQGDTSGRN